MYCRNCGQVLSSQAALCMGCGVRPPKGNLFCHNCGSQVSPLADICVKCGAGLHQVTVAKSVKSKTASVLLAVFLGYWSWLYTYFKDGWKFWVGISSSIVLTIVLVVQMAQPPYRQNSAITALIYIVLIGIGIWVIVDSARRSSQWYKNYPNG